MSKSSEIRRMLWKNDEVTLFLTIMEELNVISLMNSKKFRNADIFHRVSLKLEEQGFSRTSAQIQEKFKSLKKSYMRAKRMFGKSGAGTESIQACPYYHELDNLLRNRPINNHTGFDSVLDIPEDINQIEQCMTPLSSEKKNCQSWVKASPNSPDNRTSVWNEISDNVNKSIKDVQEPDDGIRHFVLFLEKELRRKSRKQVKRLQQNFMQMLYDEDSE